MQVDFLLLKTSKLKLLAFMPVLLYGGENGKGLWEIKMFSGARNNK